MLPNDGSPRGVQAGVQYTCRLGQRKDLLVAVHRAAILCFEGLGQVQGGGRRAAPHRATPRHATPRHATPRWQEQEHCPVACPPPSPTACKLVLRICPNKLAGRVHFFVSARCREGPGNVRVRWSLMELV